MLITMTITLFFVPSLTSYNHEIDLPQMSTSFLIRSFTTRLSTLPITKALKPKVLSIVCKIMKNKQMINEMYCYMQTQAKGKRLTQ